MGRWFRRLLHALRQSRHEADLREEIEAHRAQRAADLERDGLTAEEAAMASRRSLGNTLLARDDVRDAWLIGNLVAGCALRPADLPPESRVHGHRGADAGARYRRERGADVHGRQRHPAGRSTVPRAHELVSINVVVEGVPEFAGQTTFSTADYLAYRDRSRTVRCGGVRQRPGRGHAWRPLDAARGKRHTAWFSARWPAATSLPCCSSRPRSAGRSRQPIANSARISSSSSAIRWVAHSRRRSADHRPHRATQQMRDRRRCHRGRRVPPVDRRWRLHCSVDCGPPAVERGHPLR